MILGGILVLCFIPTTLLKKYFYFLKHIGDTKGILGGLIIVKRRNWKLLNQDHVLLFSAIRMI